MIESFSIESAQKTLQKYWKYPNFKPGQRDVIKILSERRDVIALLPTGGGKSLCYQVPALLADGITIVISPLISLMEDQVTMLKTLDIKAEAIHSGHTYGNIDRILDNCIYGNIKLLYVSPERLSHHLFLERIHKMSIDMVAIDEAHCVSQWGHDFRPSYLGIKEFIELVNPGRVIALTATATSQVIEELSVLLFKRPPAVIKESFARNNIAIKIKRTEDKMGCIINCCGDRKKTIIYVRSRRKVKMIARTISNHNVSAAFYHAGLSFKEKKKIQDNFKQDRLDVIVATNAFGMGIDIANIRRVIHFEIPPSIEEYYQEIGRAGRDGDPSEAMLLLSKDDLAYGERRVDQDFPSFEIARKIYKSVHVYYNIGINEGEGFTKALKYNELSKTIGIPPKQLMSALKLWQKLGAWEISEDSRHRIYCRITLTPKELRQEESRYPDHYWMLDYFMRNYDHLFSGWIQLDIERDSRILKIPESKFLKSLELFSENKIIKLFKLESGTRINFIRIRSSNKYLDPFYKKYTFLKSTSEKRWAGMSGLLSHESCRMLYILKYFNEDVSNSCGSCDICNPEDEQPESYQIIQRRINEGEMPDKIDLGNQE